MAERDVILDQTIDEIEQMAESPFIEIPAGASGTPQEGDTVYLLVEVQPNISEKTAGSSYQIPLAVVEDGINKGKLTDWYAGYRGNAMGIFARALKAFGKYDEVLSVKDGKTHMFIDRLAGARAKAFFIREWSQPQEAGKKPVLRAKLDSTGFLPEDAEPSKIEEIV